MTITRNWPTEWATHRGGIGIKLPVPQGRFSLDNWPRLWFDGSDEETKEYFARMATRHERSIREGDIFVEGPFAGLLAHEGKREESPK